MSSSSGNKGNRYKRSSQKKSKALGESFDVCNQRLKRIIIREFFKIKFDMMCYRCSRKIRDDEQFHVDHKDGWIYQKDPRKAFFDLDNIQCSHASCNIKFRGKRFIFRLFFGSRRRAK